MSSQGLAERTYGTGVSFAERARGSSESPKGALAAPSLVGRRITLLPVVPDHYPFLYELATSEEISFRWRYGG